MAFYFDEPSRTFNEYLLVPGYTSEETIPANVSLKTPLVKYRRGEEEPAISLNTPMVSAIMQAVSDDKMAIALATEGGLSFIYGSQSIESQAAMIARVKDYKAGFVVSDANLSPEMTLADVVDLLERTGHSTMPVTEGANPHGKLLGIVTDRDYRLTRMGLDTKVADVMTPLDKLVTAPADTSLKLANDIIWEHKLNSLPLIDDNGNLAYMVFRKDYDQHKSNPLEMLDSHKRYMVGAGINSRDYAERVPALVDAGVDVVCIDSSEGYSVWQKRTIEWIRGEYGDLLGPGDHGSTFGGNALAAAAGRATAVVSNEARKRVVKVKAAAGKRVEKARPAAKKVNAAPAELSGTGAREKELESTQFDKAVYLVKQGWHLLNLVNDYRAVLAADLIDITGIAGKAGKCIGVEQVKDVCVGNRFAYER